jgi:hypothetical protein
MRRVFTPERKRDLTQRRALIKARASKYKKSQKIGAREGWKHFRTTPCVKRRA